MRGTHTYLASIALGTVLAASANAAVLVGYDFGTPDALTQDPTTLHGGISITTQLDGKGAANDFILQETLGDNTGFAASGTSFGSSLAGNYSGTANDATGGNLSGAINDNDYVNFAFSGDNWTMTLSGFSVAAAIAGGKSAQKFNVLAKVNGDATAWTTSDALTTDQTITHLQDLGDWDDTFINLAGNPLFEDINSVEFRIYLWGGYGTTSNSRTDYDQIVVEGTLNSLIPEPSSLSLLGLGGILIAFARRKITASDNR